MTFATHIYTNPDGLNHDTGPGQPERIDRLRTILKLLKEPPFDALPVLPCRDVDTSVLLYAHPQSYIDYVRGLEPEDGHNLLTREEVVMSPGSWAASVTAATATCRAVDDIAAGTCRRAFCAVRPPGHHALPEEPMGFCFFANAFIAARHAQEKNGIRRVAIVDFDVHHGNGTDLMARSAEDIFFVSTHEFPQYPGTGDPRLDAPGKTLNIPLAPGSGGSEFRAAYRKLALPALDAFKPELLIISAGFDAHRDDPLAGLNLAEDDYNWVTTQLCAVADRHAGGRVLSLLEGGYNLDALKNSVAAHLKALAAI